ncbi:MAG: hypothetical protein ABIG64_09985 [Candidatus Omnitrophota bacterium]
MKMIIFKILLIFFIFLGICFHYSLAQEELPLLEKKSPAEEKQTLVVYNDQAAIENHYYPSERIGDGEALEFEDGFKENPQSGKTCIRIKYNATGSYGWAGIYWVNPKGNWGDLKGGFDLRFAKKLTFWAKGEKGGEHIAVFRFGGLKGVFPDSDNHGIGPIVLTPQWQEYIVDVSQRNMRYISAGFSFAMTKAHNRKGCTFYLDNIKYE